MKKMNFKFLNKFSHYLLIGLSSMVLFASVQSGMVGDFTQRGPNQVLADEEDWDQVGPANPSEPIFTEPLPEPEAPAPEAPAPAPAPVAPAPGPSCSTNFQYNQCVACNESEPVYTDSCSGAFSTGPRQYDGACAHWCVQPTPPPPQCVPNDQIDTRRHCLPGTTLMCTFNVWRGNDCSIGEGGPYACVNAPECGFAQPTPPPVQPTPPPVQPTPPPFCPIRPEQACQPGTTLLCTYDVNSCTGQRGVPYNCFNDARCGFVIPTPPPSCRLDTIQECRPGTTQLCNYTVNSCTGVRSNPFNCFNAAQCGFRPPVAPTPPPPSGAGPIIINTPPINITNNQPHTQTQNVTVSATQAAPTREVIREVRTFGNVGVAAPARVAGVTTVTELPKTGLPALAWAALAFIPLGYKVRRFSNIKEDAISKPHFIWEERQFKA